MRVIDFFLSLTLLPDPGHLALEDGAFFIQWPAVKPEIKTFRTSKPFLLFPFNEPAFLLPVHWWWDWMWKMWQMVGGATWKYYFLLTPHLLLGPVWELPFAQHLQNLPLDQNLSSKGSERENAEKFCVTTLVIFPPMNFPESRAKWNLDVDMMGNSAWIEMCHFVMATTCNITKASSIKRILVVNKSEDIWGGKGMQTYIHRSIHIFSNLFLFMDVTLIFCDCFSELLYFRIKVISRMSLKV